MIFTKKDGGSNFTAFLHSSPQTLRLPGKDNLLVVINLSLNLILTSSLSNFDDLIKDSKLKLKIKNKSLFKK